MLQSKRITKNYKHICIKKFTLLLAVSYLIVCLWLIYANSGGQTGIIVCPSKLFYHLPCPGCGITRATIKFLHCNVFDAILLNPNVIFSIAYLLICPIIITIELITKKEIAIYLYKRIEKCLHRKKIWIPIFIVEILIWIHNIMMNI